MRFLIIVNASFLKTSVGMILNVIHTLVLMNTAIVFCGILCSPMSISMDLLTFLIEK